jgi:hypothetical protein
MLTHSVNGSLAATLNSAPLYLDGYVAYMADIVCIYLPNLILHVCQKESKCLDLSYTLQLHSGF